MCVCVYCGFAGGGKLSTIVKIGFLLASAFCFSSSTYLVQIEPGSPATATSFAPVDEEAMPYHF